MRATRDFFNARMAEKKPGDVVNLTIFRFDDLSSLVIRLGERREMSYRIVPVASPTALQKQIYANWLR
jgi:predicted metalloprotease with PDZ domain